MNASLDLDNLVSRYASFFRSRAKGKFLIHVKSKQEADTVPDALTVLDLRKYDFERQLHLFLDDVRAVSLRQIGGRTWIDDDRIPLLSIRFGIAELCAFLSDRVKVTFGQHTSWTEPLLASWDELGRLRGEPRGVWFERVMEALRYLVRNNNGQYGVAVRGTLGPLDLAHALRGNELLAEVLTDPVRVHQLLSYCVRVCTEFMNAQLDAVGSCQRGTLSLFGVWLPGRAIGHMSNDASALCSPEIYRDFGRPYDQELICPFSGALFHVHTLGLHLLPQIARLEKLFLIQIEEDPNQPPVASRLEPLIEAAKGTPLMICLSASQIRENIELLREGQFIFQARAENETDARDIVEFVRANSRGG